jgi:hypothetical protein
MKFIYRNEQHVKIVARRSSDTWAAFTNDDRKSVKELRQRWPRRTAAADQHQLRRHLRVAGLRQLPRPPRGAALGFAASVEYTTRDLTVDQIANGGGGTWPAFVAWLSDQPAYQTLRQELEALQCVC